jgi:DNA-binding IclR family transcriptional regulator
VHGLVARTGDGRYVLGPGLVALGRAAEASPVLAARARPALLELREATGESVQLYVRERGQRRCVESLESPHGLRTIVAVGDLMPLDRGSAGRVLVGDPGRSPAGWVQTVGEREPGVASVSAPVRAADGDVVAAVSVSGPISRMGRQPGRRYGEAVAAAAVAIERALGLAEHPHAEGAE